MKKKLYFAFLIFLGMLISCNKDIEIQAINNFVAFDTIKPMEFFPAYPGSYWIYDNNETLKVANQYEKYIYNSAGYTSEPEYDTLVLPKFILNGIYNQGDTFAYLKEYSLSKSSSSNYRDPAFKKLLSLTEGSEFVIGEAVQGHKTTGKTIKVDTSIFIGTQKYENVIVIIQFDNSFLSEFAQTPEECAFLREYYAKNIGLIKREKRNYPMDTVFIKDIEITKYEINR